MRSTTVISTWCNLNDTTWHAQQVPPEDLVYYLWTCFFFMLCLMIMVFSIPGFSNLFTGSTLNALYFWWQAGMPLDNEHFYTLNVFLIDYWVHLHFWGRTQYWSNSYLGWKGPLYLPVIVTQQQCYFVHDHVFIRLWQRRQDY